MEDFEHIILEEYFEVINQSAPGGQAIAYTVTEKSTGQKQILKVYNKIDNLDALKEDVLKEFSMLHSINHVNIVKAYKTFLVNINGNTLPAFSMEFVEGISLSEFLKREENKIIRQKRFLDIARSLSAGLMGCHRRGYRSDKQGLERVTQILKKALIHNDIHLDNIICRPNKVGGYDYVLIDFGVSFMNNKENIQSGYFPFCPPEKFTGDQISTQSDIYSLGIVFYYLLMGEYPYFLDEDKTDIFWYKNQHMNAPIPDVFEKRVEYLNKLDLPVKEPDFDYWICELIIKCLQKSPEDRFRDAQELNFYIESGEKGKLEKEWRLEERAIEEKEWHKAYLSDKIEALELFIENYPKSKYCIDAQDAIQDIRANETKSKELESAFINAINENTLEAIEGCLESYPRHPKRIELLSQKELLKEEFDLRNRYLKKPNKKELLHFEKNFPNSTYLPELRQVQIEIDRKKSKWFKKFSKFTVIGMLILCTLSFGFYGLRRYIAIKELEQSIFKKNESFLNAYYKIEFSKNKDKINADNLFLFPLHYFGKTYHTKQVFNSRNKKVGVNLVNAIHERKMKYLKPVYSFERENNITIVYVSFISKKGVKQVRKEKIELKDNKIISILKE